MSDNGSPLWRDRRFATYWAGQGVSELGDRVTELAIPLIAVTMLHASPSAVGFLTAAVWLPNIASLFVGAWVDGQARKQRVMVWANVIQGLAMLTLPVAYAFGAITLTHLFVVALVAGLTSVFYQTSYPTFFVSLVRRDQYVEANSLVSTTRSGSFIAGPALGGLLIQVLTAPVAIVVDALSFFVGALLTHRVDVDEAVRERETSADGLLRRSRDGMRFVLRHPYLKVSLGCSTTINFFNFVASALIILYASRGLGLSAGVIGLTFGIGATGGLLGVVLAGRVARRIGTGPTIAVGAVIFSAPMALVPLASGPVWARAAALALVEFVSSVGVMLFDINNNAVQSAVTPDPMRSRVAGAFSTINYGIRPLGAVVGGLCGELVGVGPTMIAAGVGGSLSVLWLLGSPTIRVRSVDGLDAVDVPPHPAPA
ncbi:MFS transporter [Luteipulveratus halotolerans]|uniref:Transporter n=1 Tax=Luteipulveratus halotolerans TaxID=1631356 RepID=A0A0L6CF03_9MICO|nr:MFS transporter [Luteipulveratus halotolerans]KNX36269.1 transporter [Luteipulveratus halotolerans]